LLTVFETANNGPVKTRALSHVTDALSTLLTLPLQGL
jgi:hypothetical protein